MATAVTNETLVGEPSAAQSGFWAKVFAGFIAAREAEARRRVADHVIGMSDERLVAMGFSAKDIGNIRSGGRV